MRTEFPENIFIYLHLIVFYLFILFEEFFCRIVQQYFFMPQFQIRFHMVFQKEVQYLIDFTEITSFFFVITFFSGKDIPHSCIFNVCCLLKVSQLALYIRLQTGISTSDTDCFMTVCQQLSCLLHIHRTYFLILYDRLIVLFLENQILFDTPGFFL